MGTIIRRLAGGRGRGLTATNTKRLQPFDDPERCRALLALPERLMASAKKSRNRVAGAILAQTGAAIEILLMAPLRLKNLANLDLERHLVRIGEELHIVIDAEHVKNRQQLQFPLPPESAELIERYVQEYRPALVTRNDGALFPGRNAGPKQQQVMGRQISRTIYSYTGLEINPHLFRHIAAKMYLDANPGSYEVVRLLLGHQSIKTTLSFYTGLEHPAAARHFHANVLRLRQRRKKPIRKRRPTKRSRSRKLIKKNRDDQGS